MKVEGLVLIVKAFLHHDFHFDVASPAEVLLHVFRRARNFSLMNIPNACITTRLDLRRPRREIRRPI